MRGARVLVAVTALALVGSAPIAPAEAATPGTLTAGATTDLVHGQSIRVSGGAWRPNSAVSLRQCPTGLRSDRWCDVLGEAQVGPGGRFAKRVHLAAVLDPVSGTTSVDCRDPEACDLVASQGSGPVRLPLHFDPTGPDPPRATGTATPDTDLVHLQRVVVQVDDLVPRADRHFPRIEQCVRPGEADEVCDYRTRVIHRRPTADPLRLSFVVRSRIVAGKGGESYDCRQGGCVIRGGWQASTAAIVPIQLRAEGYLPPWPDVEVAPVEDLVDAQTVTFTARSFPVFTEFDLRQCPADWSELGRCSRWVQSSYQSDEEGGTLVEPFTVRAVNQRPDGSTFDCRVVACVLHLKVRGPTPEADLPLAFDAEAPVRSPRFTARPTLGLDPASSVNLEGRDFVPGGIIVRQCVGRTAESSRCGPDRHYEVGQDFLRRGFPVARLLRTRELGDVDCRLRRCFVRVSGHASQPLLFSPRLQFRA